MKKMILFIFIVLCAGNSFNMKRTEKHHSLVKGIKIKDSLAMKFEHHCIESQFVDTAHRIYIFMLLNNEERKKNLNKYLADANSFFDIIIRPYCELHDRLRALFGNHEGGRILRSFIDRFVDLVANNFLVALYFLDVLDEEFDFIDEEEEELLDSKISKDIIKEKIKTYVLNI